MVSVLAIWMGGDMGGDMRHLIWAIPMALALAGCGGVSMGGMFKPKTASSAVASGVLAPTATPLDTAAIQTQTLAPAAAGSAGPATAPATGRVIGAAVPVAAQTPVPPAPTPQSAAEIGAAAAAALQKTSPAAAPAAALSPEQQTCLAKGGRWELAGNTGANLCVVPTKDAGKSCSKESDCSSQCLARSRSCAPFWPIYGCSDVIQDNGAVVKLCIE